MNFVYKIGYGSYEDSDFAEMTHELKFSEEELHVLVSCAITRALRGVISGEYREFISEDGISYDNIHNDVVKELQKDGFKLVDYQAEWSCFGWPSLTCKEAWGEQRGDILNRLYEEIPRDVRDGIMELARAECRERDDWRKERREKQAREEAERNQQNQNV